MIETKQLDHLDSMSGPSFPLNADVPVTQREVRKDSRLAGFRSRLSKVAKNPLFLVILTWTVMAFLLAFEVAAKK